MSDTTVVYRSPGQIVCEDGKVEDFYQRKYREAGKAGWATWAED